MIRSLLTVALFLLLGTPIAHAAGNAMHYGWEQVDGIKLFFREGGPADGPMLVLLHGAPSSSTQYQAVMEQLAASGIHVLAMDYPSFGYSEAPDRKTYHYTFDNLTRIVDHFLVARGVDHYALYMQDFGVPIGFRLLQQHPERVTALIVQNGVIHLDGFPAAQDAAGELRQHWLKRNPALDARRLVHANNWGFPAADTWTDSDTVNPDTILLALTSQHRPGVVDARNDLWFDYGWNVLHYPQWQQLLRASHLPLMVIWGTEDPFFTTPGALAYLRDAPQAELHLFKSTHFATLDHPDAIAAWVLPFMRRLQSP